VEVSQNPTGPAQTCVLTGNTGKVSGADVSGANVVCSVLTLNIQSITSTGPGQTPQISFQAQVAGAPADLIATPLTSLVVTVSGPTTDYAQFWQETIQGTGATGTLAAQGGGSYIYTFPSPIPASATGSYAFASCATCHAVANSFGVEVYHQIP